MGFEEEIHRMLSGTYNYTEPPAKATVLSVANGKANIKLIGVDMEPFQEVPILKPPFDGIGDINLIKNDTVLVEFTDGSLSGPVIIGKI